MTENETVTQQEELASVDEPVPETIVVVEDRPFLETSFDEYTVTEGLLLLLVVALVMAVVWNLLKEGISWLR